MAFNKKNIRRTIYLLLLKFPELRDDWLATAREVHILEMDIYGIKHSDYFETLYYSEILTSHQTIGRIWRFIQEQRPHLRGAMWSDRQKQSSTVKKSILNIDDNQKEIEFVD